MTTTILLFLIRGNGIKSWRQGATVFVVDTRATLVAGITGVVLTAVGTASSGFSTAGAGTDWSAVKGYGGQAASFIHINMGSGMSGTLCRVCDIY